MNESQQTILDAIVRVLSADARVQSAWLTGSLGKGAGDDYSDIDVTVVVLDAPFDAALAAYSGDLSAIADVVCMNIVAGRVLNAITSGWERFDLTFVKPREFAAMPLGAIRPLFNRGTAERAATPEAPYKPPAQRILQLTTEFIRVLGLLPVVLGREEYVLAQDGTGLLRRMTLDLMLERNGVSPIARGGALHINNMLTPEQRRLLESLPPVVATRESAIGSAQQLAQLFLPLAKQLAAEAGARWPSSFEDATRLRLASALGLQI